MLPRLLYSVRGMNARLGVNDAPFVSDPRGYGLSGAAPLGEWLMPGANRITGEFAPLERAVPYDARMEILLEQEPPRPPVVAVQFEFPAARRFEPFRLSLPFAFDGAVPTRVFAESRRNLSSAGGDAAAKEAGRALHKAFAARDVDAVMQLLEYRNAEFARAFERPEDPAETRAEFASLLGGGTDYELADLDEARYVATPVANGHLVHLTRDGGDLISVYRPESKSGFSLPVYVAFVDGAWRVAR